MNYQTFDSQLPHHW